MRTKNLVPHSGKGKELNDLLRRELGIPDSAKSYTVHFAVNEAVTVTCEYFALEKLANGFVDTNTLADTSTQWALFVSDSADGSP